MKKLSFLIIVIVASFGSVANVSAQGCVALRGSGAAYMVAHPDEESAQGWIFTSSLRYFKSYKHYSGTTENIARLTDGSNVINHQTTIDLSLVRIFNNRWSLLIDAPIQANSRSSLYEHGLVNGVYIKKERHTMHTFGLGDTRVALYRWMFNPLTHKKYNLQLGLGIKLATGDYNAQDYWYNVGPGGTNVLRPVDQSIQLGDGGTGFTVEANTFYNLAKHFNVYGNFYYLINPREQNGTRTYRETLAPSLANEAICSVPDQYMARVGFSYTSKSGFSASLGGRVDGIPVNDLVGGSGDFRRPGFVLSAEPQANYSFHKINIFASLPFALVRNRLQSVTDQQNSVKYNKFVRGDAAFADYVVNLGISVKL